MDQKTLLAIILSVAVLFGYETIFVAPKRAEMLKNSQITANKEVTEKTTVAEPIASQEQQKSTAHDFKEEKWDLKTTEFSSNLTNVGGILHNIKIDGYHPLPLSQILAIKGIEEKQFQLVSQADQKMVFAYDNDDWHIVKTYEVQDNYTIHVKIDLTNTKSISRLENIEFVLIGINSSKLDASNRRETMLDEYSVFADKKILRKGNAFKFNAKENKSQAAQVQWTGFRDHYSAVVVHPEFKTKTFDINALTENSLNISIKPEPQAVYEFTVFVGPQDMALMKKYGKKFETIVAFSNWWPLDMIAKAIYHTIPFLHSIFRSWGISIILISVIIYGLTYPLTFKSMMSMRRMQQVQPKIKALQVRYKSDPQKLNAEIMDIYKREKINPLGGCLPFLLQMPIFIALYQVLWRSSYFQGKGFLWIKDLAQPDRLFILPFSLPIIGNEFNILPLLMAGVMFAQQKLSAKNMVVADEQQAMQQKMMMYFFPVFIGFIFYKFASGLSLYFTVFYLLSTLTQWKMSKIK